MALIPTKNGPALAAYYVGLFSLIPMIGGLLCLIAIPLGIAGLNKVSQNPEVEGRGHAIAGIVLGLIGAVITYGGFGALVVNAINSAR